MSLTRRRDASFIVRVWWEQRESAPPIWRGQVQHAASGQTAFFQTVGDLLRFIEHWTGNLTPPASASKPQIDSTGDPP